MSETIILALIAALGTGFAGWLTYLTQRTIKQGAVVTGKLGQIHELVNSNMDAQVQLTLNHAKAQLVTLDQLLALQQSGGKALSKDAMVAREALVREVNELARQLKERAKTTEIADSKLV